MPILLVPYLLGMEGKKHLGFTVVCQAMAWIKIITPKTEMFKTRFCVYTNFDTIPYIVQVVREAQWLMSQNPRNILPRGLLNVRMPLPLEYTVHWLYVCDALKCGTGRWSTRLNAWKPAEKSRLCVKLLMLLVFFALCLVGSSATFSHMQEERQNYIHFVVSCQESWGVSHPGCVFLYPQVHICLQKKDETMQMQLCLTEHSVDFTMFMLKGNESISDNGLTRTDRITGSIHSSSCPKVNVRAS